MCHPMVLEEQYNSKNIIAVSFCLKFVFICTLNTQIHTTHTYSQVYHATISPLPMHMYTHTHTYTHILTYTHMYHTTNLYTQAHTHRNQFLNSPHTHISHTQHTPHTHTQTHTRATYSVILCNKIFHLSPCT